MFPSAPTIQEKFLVGDNLFLTNVSFPACFLQNILFSSNSDQNTGFIFKCLSWNTGNQFSSTSLLLNSVIVFPRRPEIPRSRNYPVRRGRLSAKNSSSWNGPELTRACATCRRRPLLSGGRRDRVLLAYIIILHSMGISCGNRSYEILWTWHQGQLQEQAGFLVSSSLTLSFAHV